MSDPTEGFIRAFEEIVREVNRRAGAESSYSFEIERASERDGSIRRNRTLLLYIRDVRNALQHPKHRSDGHAIHVSDEFLDEVRALLKFLRNPPTANSVGVPRNEIKIARLTDRLGDLADQMKQGGFSHLPILDQDNVVIGFLTKPRFSIFCGQSRRRSSVVECRFPTSSTTVGWTPITQRPSRS